MSNFNKLKGKLTDSEKREITELVTHGCQVKVKQAVYSVLDRRSSQIPFNECLNNIYKTSKGWEVGTSNPFDFVEMRKAIRNI
jgi:hypothetical protein